MRGVLGLKVALFLAQVDLEALVEFTMGFGALPKGFSGLPPPLSSSSVKIFHSKLL